MSKLNDLFERQHINSTYIAEAIGMTRSTFRNKLAGIVHPNVKTPYAFTEEEEKAIYKALAAMMKDIRKFLIDQEFLQDYPKK